MSETITLSQAQERQDTPAINTVSLEDAQNRYSEDNAVNPSGAVLKALPDDYKMPELTPKEIMQDFEYGVTKMAEKIFTYHTGKTPAEGEEGKKDFENVMSRAPLVGISFYAPVVALGFEALGQAKNAFVTAMKGTQWSPLDRQILSELVPESVDWKVRLGLSVTENLTDIALIAGAMNVAKQGLLKDTVKIIGNKLSAAGYGEGKMDVDLNALKVATKGTTVEAEAARWLKAKTANIPAKGKLTFSTKTSGVANAPMVVPSKSVIPVKPISSTITKPTVADITPDKNGISPIDKKIQVLEEKGLIKEQAQEELNFVKEQQKEYKGLIKPHKDGSLKEEYAEIPTKYKSKNEVGMAMDEVADQIGISEVELSSYLKNVDSQADRLRQTIEDNKSVLVKRKEITVLKDKVRNMEIGIRKGQALEKSNIEDLQSDLVRKINGAGLEPKDRAKFLSLVKNANTLNKYKEALDQFSRRAEQYLQSTEKNKLESQINKSLKYTKPLKQGQSRVGKYDYESNVLFNELRSFNGMTKATAEAELLNYSEAPDTEFDLIKKRFLSLKANGKTASVEAYQKVQDDIMRMKLLGQEAKSEADFIKAVNRAERADDAISSMADIKADKNTIKTKVGNLYREGFSNQHSLFNSMFGKKFADKYNSELVENNRDIGIFKTNKAASQMMKKVYDIDNEFEIIKSLESEKYQLTDFDNLTTEVSKWQIIDIYNSTKNEMVRERYNNSYGEEQVDGMLSKLTEQDKMFADYLMDKVQDYRPILNERNIEIKGQDLGFVENYWPATSEFQANVFDDIRIQGETPSAMKARVQSGNVIPKPSNAWEKYQRHVVQAEHIKNLSRQYETLKRMFTDRKVKHEISNKFGDDVYSTLMAQIEEISLNARMQKVDFVSKVFRNAINNWVTSKIAAPNISTFVRQLMSVGNYMEKMDPVKWTKGFAEGIKTPKKTFDFMWKNSPFLETRFHRGYSEAVRDAIEGAEKISAGWSRWTNGLTTLTRVGDVSAIVYGGYPYVKAQIAAGKSIEQAFEAFRQETLRSQQSSLSSSLSQFQNSRNPFARLFLAFKNTSHQYFRKMVDSIISFQNGDIGKEQLVKTLAIYAIIQPFLYVLGGKIAKDTIIGAGNLVFDDEDDKKDTFAQDVLVQMAVSPVNAVPVLDDLMTYAARKTTGLRTWKVMSTPLLDDIATGMMKAYKKEPDLEDYLIAASAVVEPATAFPLKTIIRYYKYFTE